MKQIKLLSMHIQNFKGCKDRTIEFGEKTRISGANATGKTTIFDRSFYKRRTDISLHRGCHLLFDFPVGNCNSILHDFQILVDP